ncbi:hypothetical protein ACSTB0_13440, partial [Faecalibacterium wellingii]
MVFLPAGSAAQEQKSYGNQFLQFDPELKTPRALSLVAYLFFRVPFYGGSSFHLGNTFTALTALLLDGVSGGLA